MDDVSVSHVQRICCKHGIKPQQSERRMFSNDPDSETKAAAVTGLNLNPLDHAAVFWVDKKTTIHALDLTARMLPQSPGRAASHGFEYKRNGTLSPFAAFNASTGGIAWLERAPDDLSDPHGPGVYREEANFMGVAI